MSTRSCPEKLSFADIIGLWPSRATFAADLNVKVSRVHKWAGNAGIPARFYLAILKAAATRKIALSADQLCRAAAMPVEDLAPDADEGASESTEEIGCTADLRWSA
ncbi:hypothetical protein [Pseudooceanicola atlanticus]|uniref:hypothetical protein n=1 Tax=Pseudooceanicola atlanticus TaxID=1461694 RepID=UPI002351FD1D|nr:hypothetical protein [Pseudooceanicola atlanticus]